LVKLTFDPICVQPVNDGSAVRLLWLETELSHLNQEAVPEGLPPPPLEFVFETVELTVLPTVHDGLAATVTESAELNLAFAIGANGKMDEIKVKEITCDQNFHPNRVFFIETAYSV
jgi:hypothetical protein